MREIKFKFFYTDVKEWIAKVFTLEEIMNGWPFEVISDQPFLRNYKMVGRAQYTGLKDANGVEIYEGDIVGPCSNGRFWVIEWGSFGDTGFYGSNQINSCRRLEQGPYIDDGAILEITENETLECVVIGNIHENKELLG